MRIKFIGFCRFYHRINFHTGICSGWCITKKPVLTAYYQWSDAVFAEIITQATCTIFRIVHHERTITIRIVDCLDQPISGFRMQLVKPRQKSLYDRFLILLNPVVKGAGIDVMFHTPLVVTKTAAAALHVAVMYPPPSFSLNIYFEDSEAYKPHSRFYL